MAHFCGALSMRDEGVVTQLLGMGLGHPKTYVRRHTGARPLARVGDSHDNPSGSRCIPHERGQACRSMILP